MSDTDVLIRMRVSGTSKQVERKIDDLIAVIQKASEDGGADIQVIDAAIEVPIRWKQR